jgi:hypothetical protein
VKLRTAVSDLTYVLDEHDRQHTSFLINGNGNLT